MQALNHFFGYLLGWIMWLLYGAVKNYGVAIILFTLVTKLIVFPMSIKQQKSTAQMSAFQPKIAALQKKYGKNKEKMQEEQMKLYAEEGINPMSSCLPMLLTFGLLFGVIDVVYRPLTHIMHLSSEMVAQATEIAKGVFQTGGLALSGGEAALASFAKSYQVQLYTLQAFAHQPDAFANLGADFMRQAAEFNESFYFLGINLGQNPQMAWPTILIPILAVATQLLVSIYSQWYQKKNNPSAPGMGAMTIMMYAMPFMSGWFALGLPAGVGLYWIAQSVFSFFQQFALNKIYTPQKVMELLAIEREKKRKKGPSRMQKALKLQEEMKKANMSPDGKAAREAILAKLRENKPVSAGEAQLLKSAQEEENPQSEVIETTAEEVSVDEQIKRLSGKEMKDLNRQIIAEARRRMAEKYGEEYEEADTAED